MLRNLYLCESICSSHDTLKFFENELTVIRSVNFLARKIDSVYCFEQLDDPQSSALEVKADVQLRSHQNQVAKPAAGACGFVRKKDDDCLEKRTTFWINTQTFLRCTFKVILA